VNDDTDVRNLLQAMAAEVGPVRTNPETAARKARGGLLRTAMIGVLVLALFAVGGVAGARAFRASNSERPAARVPSPSPSSTNEVVIVSQSSLVTLPVGDRFELDSGLIYMPEAHDARTDVQLARRGVGLVLIFRLSRPVRLPGNTVFADESPSGLRSLVYKPVGTHIPVAAGEVLAVRTNESNYTKLQVTQCCGSSSRPYIEFRFVTNG
jgi:hypothetical protein